MYLFQRCDLAPHLLPEKLVLSTEKYCTACVCTGLTYFPFLFVQIMEMKWLLYVTLLALGTLAAQEHDVGDDDGDVIDIEDDLDDGVEEIEDSNPESSTPPPAPKVWHRCSLKFNYCLCFAYWQSDQSCFYFAEA